MIFDLTISLGNLLTMVGGTVVVGLYIIDTRLSATNATTTIAATKAQIEQITAEVENSARDATVLIERSRREFSDTGSVLRESIRDVELFVRDTFARRDEMRELNATIQAQLQDIKTGLNRIESRMMNGK